MDVPTLVSKALGDEDVAAHVPLKGEDGLFITPTRTIRYAAEGLLSDESVAEFSHDAERVLVSQGRRKATIELDYGTDGSETFTVPAGELDRALHSVLAGVLNANDVTGPGETVIRTFRFSELTVVVTSDRVIKHIGSAVWDHEFEEIPYGDVTGIDIEEGNVSSQFVLRTDTRTQRLKAPNESFRSVRESIEEAVLSYHGVDSVEKFERLLADETEESPEETDDVSFDSEVDPVGAPSTETETETSDPVESEPEPATDPADELEQQGFDPATNSVEPAIDPEVLRARLVELEDTIEQQQAVLDAQRDVIEELADLIPDR